MRAIEISTCKSESIHIFVEVLSMELTESAMLFFKYHPNFTPVPKQCLLCGGWCDVRVLFDAKSITDSITDSITNSITNQPNHILKQHSIA